MVELKCVVCGKEAEYVDVHSYCEECYRKRMEKWKEDKYEIRRDRTEIKCAEASLAIGIVLAICFIGLLNLSRWLTIVLLVSGYVGVYFLLLYLFVWRFEGLKEGGDV